MSNAPSIWNHVKKPHRMAACHPDRKHRAHGLCSPCYWSWHGKNYRPTLTRSQRASLGKARAYTYRRGYMERVEATLTEHFCAICTMNYNPELNRCQLRPEICGLCHVEFCECTKTHNLLEFQFKEIVHA